MAVYRNFDVQTRVWINLQRADGRTLELEPGESCDDVEFPDGFEDPYLQPASRRVKRDGTRASDPQTDAATDDVPAAADETSEQDGDAGSSDVAVAEQES